MSFIMLWDGSPEIISVGPFTLRWYSICFTTAFLASLPIWHHMFLRAGKSIHDAERLKLYLITGVIVGARLGHVFFYEWSYYKDHLSKIFLPVVFEPTFKVVGFSGLASHGAACGMILAILFYVKRIVVRRWLPLRISFQDRQPAGTFLWSLDHLVVLIALGGSFIRIGNFMNTEIIGRPTGKPYGIVFARDVHEDLCIAHADLIADLAITKDKQATLLHNQRYDLPIVLTVTFLPTEQDAVVLKTFLEGSFKNSLVRLSYCDTPMIYEQYGTPLSYTLVKSAACYQAVIHTSGIPRHPAQLYEAASCFLLFLLLFHWWRKWGQSVVPGRMSGAAMLFICLLRFFYEFYKENQVAFEADMWLNMGQLLSLPWIILGLYLMLRLDPRKNTSEQHLPA